MNYFDKFALVKRFYVDTPGYTYEAADAIATLMTELDLSSAQVRVLSVLIACYPDGISGREAARIMGTSTNNVLDELYELNRRSIILGSGHWSPEDRIRLSGWAFQALHNNRKLISPAKNGITWSVNRHVAVAEPGEDLFKSLSETAEDNIYGTEDADSEEHLFVSGPVIPSGGDWFEKNKRSLLNSNDPIAKAYRESGVSKMSIQAQRLFFIFALHFIQSFTVPVKRNDIRSNFLGGAEELINAGLLEIIPCYGDDDREIPRFLLSQSIARDMFHGHDEIVDYTGISMVASALKPEKIEKKDLFFSPESQEEIDHLYEMLSPKGFERACGILKKKKHNPAIISLLWGGPGTGKTEVVKQMALESGRDILLCDVAKMTASSWGDTEKLYRLVFREYGYIVAVKSVTPILFLNEADQILCKRITNIERSIDKSENTIVNIMLQGMEDMSGILLATTNLITNLDEAFDRRFLFKTRLETPDAGSRKKIWQSSIPELSEEEAAMLATAFEMSGAQINNVVVKRDMAELYYSGDRGYSYIADLCRKEVNTTTGRNRRIGF